MKYRRKNPNAGQTQLQGQAFRFKVDPLPDWFQDAITKGCLRPMAATPDAFMLEQGILGSQILRPGYYVFKEDNGVMRIYAPQYFLHSFEAIPEPMATVVHRPLSLEDVKDILLHVSFQDWEFLVERSGNGFLIQAAFDAPDNSIHAGPITRQKTRKWYQSAHSTKDEVVKTCLLCVLTAHEHEIREIFKYQGVPLFHPHTSIDALQSAARHRVLRAIVDPIEPKFYDAP